MSHSPKPSNKSLLDSVDLTKPLYSGIMYKQSHIPPKNFNKRFFVLFPKILVYYDTEKDFKRDVASRTLAHRHKAILTDHLYLSKPDKKPNGAKFCFILHAPHAHNERHDFLLVAETRESRRVWMDRLQEENPRLKESDHHHRGSSSSGSLLAVPQPRRLRADSVTPDPTDNDSDDVQTMDISEARSDDES